MTITRTYGEACPIAHGMDMIGDRWAMLVVRELRLGPRRFSDLQVNLPNAGPNMLAQRLRDLERVGVVARRTLPPPAGAKIYELTEWGSELEPVFRALARWAIRAPVPPQGERLSPDSVMLGIRTFFTDHDDSPWSATYAVHLGRESYRLSVVDGRLEELTRRPDDNPVDATIACTNQMTLHALATGRATLRDLIDREELTISGSIAAARRLVDTLQRSKDRDTRARPSR